MSLMQLLAVGRTLKGIRNEAHRYRDVTDRNLLPRFGTSKPQLAAEPNVPAPARRTTPLPAAAVSAESDLNKQAGAQKHADQAPASTERKDSSLAAVVCGQRGKWFVARDRSATSAVSSPVAVSTRSDGVQIGMSLDNVQVVRNDLSDADLEVVPALRPGPNGREETTWVTASKRETGPSVWSRATTKLFAALHL